MAGVQTVTIHVKARIRSTAILRGETGVHRLVRISPFGTADKRQTSFASVEVMPEIDDTIDIELKDDELKRDVFRCGGPGGQHQNKTESGVRYTHIPTGVAAESRSRAVAAQERQPGAATPQGQADPGSRKRSARPNTPRRTTRRPRSASAARSATTSSSPTSGARTSGPR